MATYTYVTITTLTPKTGSAAGGQGVTITGYGFTAATGVTFGGTAATNVAIVSNTVLTCVTPAHNTGLVTVEVLGVTSLVDAYTYTLPTQPLLPPVPFRVPVLQQGGLIEVSSWGRWFSEVKLRIENPETVIAAEQIVGTFNPDQIPQLPFSRLTLTAPKLLGRATPGTGDSEQLSVLPPLALTSAGLGLLGAPGGFTQGSVVFAGAGGAFAQDNAQLFWDDTRHALGIGIHPIDSNKPLCIGGPDGTVEAFVIYSAPCGIEFKNYANTVQYGAIFSITTGAGGMVLSTNGTTNPLLLNTNAGPVRVGSATTPTARLHIAAGTTAASTAPMKLDSGPLLTTAEAGAVEFLTDKFYGTITTGAARKTFAFLESPQFVTPDIGAATGTSLTLSGALSSPSLIAAAALTITPAAGSNLNVALSTTGDFAVNTNQLYVDTSAARVGVNIATPTQALSVVGEIDFYVGATLRGIVGPSSWATNFFSFQNRSLAESASNFALSQDDSGNTYVNAASGTSLFLRVNNSTQMSFTNSVINVLFKFSKYNNIATAGWGVPAIYGSGRSTAQTAAVASVAAYTVGAADGSFLVSANVNVTTATTHNFTVQVAYTDETNTAQTLTLTFSQLTGVLVTAITNVTGAGPYEGLPMQIRCKASTAITVKTAGTFTTVTYNVEGCIAQVS